MILDNGLAVSSGGEETSSCKRVSSAAVDFNGTEIFRRKDFNQRVERLEQPVDVLMENELRVEIASPPGSCFTVEIACGERNTPPIAHAGPDQTVSPEADRVTATAIP
jgi:hypothetical protein